MVTGDEKGPVQTGVNNMITIIDMEPEHVDQVAVLEKQCFTLPWSASTLKFEVERNRLAHYVVATWHNRVVGYAGMWVLGPEAHVTNVGVHRDYRRRGIGELLMRFLMYRAASNGAGRMSLEVRRSNGAAQRLYEKLGFAGVGYRPGYYTDNGEDALIMWHYDLPGAPRDRQGSGGPGQPGRVER